MTSLIVQYLRIVCCESVVSSDGGGDGDGGGGDDDDGGGGGGDDGGGGTERFAASSCRRKSAISAFKAAFFNSAFSWSEMSSICKNIKNYFFNKRYRLPVLKVYSLCNI